MKDSSYKYSADGSYTGAASNKLVWLKVKIKNTLRYAGIAAVILGFYHIFALYINVPHVDIYLTLLGEYAGTTSLYGLASYNFAVAVVGMIYVWFGP